MNRCLSGILCLVLLFPFSMASSSRADEGAAEAAGPPPAQAEPGELTLGKAVDLAMRFNPLVRATRPGREMADAQLKEAQAGWFPLLQFNETFTRSNNPVFVFGSLLEQHRFGPQNFNIDSLNHPDALNNYRTALNLKVPLFDQLETGTRISRARIGREQADRNEDLVQQHVRLEVVRSYYHVLVSQARNGVAEEAVKMAESEARRIQDLYETGIVVQSDLLSARVQLSEFRQQRIQAEGELATAFAALNTTLGIPVESPVKISGGLAEKNFALPNSEELARLALIQRPDYARAASAVKSADEQVRGAWGKYLPRVDVFSSYGLSGKDLMTSGGPDYAVGAGLSYNLFDLGRGAKLDQARAGRTLARIEQEHLASQIRLEVVKSYQQYISAREKMENARDAVAQAEEALRIVRDRYQAGLVTITEVLRSQTAYVRARLNLLSARYEYYIGYAHVLMATGGLKSVQAFES